MLIIPIVGGVGVILIFSGVGGLLAEPESDIPPIMLGVGAILCLPLLMFGL